MSTNQKYSTRIHSRRQLGRASDNVRSALGLLCDVKQRYLEALPIVAQGCGQLVEMLNMCENMICDIRDNI